MKLPLDNIQVPAVVCDRSYVEVGRKHDNNALPIRFAEPSMQGRIPTQELLLHRTLLRVLSLCKPSRHSQVIGSGVTFTRSRGPAARHKAAETWAAHPRAVLPKAVASRQKFVYPPSPSQDKRKTIAFGIASRLNPEGCGFLFLSHFRSDNSHMKRPGKCSTFSLGGLSLFSALSFFFCLPSVL